MFHESVVLCVDVFHLSTTEQNSAQLRMVIFSAFRETRGDLEAIFC